MRLRLRLIVFAAVVTVTLLPCWCLSTFSGFSVEASTLSAAELGRRRGPPAASEWKYRTIYQVLTDRFERTTIPGDEESQGAQEPCDLHSYCGGTFRGIARRLDYVKELGCNAIWISPVVRNTPDGYHGYWLSSLWDINEQFGTALDLRRLVEECHKRDIWVMVDVVLNHVGVVDLDFAQIKPFDHPAHYHAKCQVTDFTNQTEMEVCRLFNLPDLD